MVAQACAWNERKKGRAGGWPGCVAEARRGDGGEEGGEGGRLLIASTPILAYWRPVSVKMRCFLSRIRVGRDRGKHEKKGGQEVGWHSLGRLGGAEGAGGGRGGEEGERLPIATTPILVCWKQVVPKMPRRPPPFITICPPASRPDSGLQKGPRLSQCRGPGSEPRLALHSVNCGPRVEPTANKAWEEQGDARFRKTERSQESRSHRRSSSERKR